MKLVEMILVVSLASILTACGLKKPLANPDKAYPNQADCQCENDRNE